MAEADHLQEGERILATLIASVRTPQNATDLSLASPMTLVLTSRRLLTFQTGTRGRPRRFLGAFDIAELGPVQVDRVGLGATLTLLVGGAELRLESRVDASRAFAAEIERLLGR